MSRPAAAGPESPAGLAAFASLLASRAGEQIMAGFRAPRQVYFKDAHEKGGAANSNPVTAVDLAVEAWLRGEIQSRYPHHGLIGEEGSRTVADGDHTWVLDPIDGTANFCNGIPVFSCCIGVLERGVPVAGAIWSSCTHRAEPGVYTAHRGGLLMFGDEPVQPLVPGHWQGIITQYEELPALRGRYSTRCLGSAGVDFCCLASGMSQVMQLRGPRIWDLAAGMALLQATGQSIWRQQGEGWTPLTGFGDPRVVGVDPLAAWQHDVIAGTPATLGPLIR